MKGKNFIKSALKVIEIESKAVMSLSDQIQPDFENLCKEILSTKGKLILMGIGKSGHIAQKISATLSSTGTSSLFIHPTEAAHGDLGMIDKQDSVLIFSNSGETKEIIEILPALKRSAANIFTITNNNQSTISKAGNINLVISSQEEACPLDLAPTSSTTIALVFGDALAIALLEARGFGKDDFAKSHPAGQLGKKLTTLVQDLAVMNEKVPIVNHTTSLKDALMTITEKKLGLALIIKDKKVLSCVLSQMHGIFAQVKENGNRVKQEQEKEKEEKDIASNSDTSTQEGLYMNITNMSQSQPIKNSKKTNIKKNEIKSVTTDMFSTDFLPRV